MAPKPRELNNPFLRDKGLDSEHNLLSMTHWDEMDRRLENIIISSVDSYRAEHKTNYKDIVSKHKVFQILKHCEPLTVVSVQEWIGCSKRQAQQYIAVVSTVIILVNNTLKFPLRLTTGYIDITRSQMTAGYLL